MPREIKVYIRGKNPKISREELRFASKYMYYLLVSSRMHNQTTLFVESVPIKDRKEIDGLMHVKDPKNKHPKKFRIVLNTRNGKRKQLCTLAHELVHVKQYAKGEMGNTYISQQGITYTKWKGRLINEDKIHYFDLHWEIEAAGREYGIYRRYLNFVKEHKIKFRQDRT